MNRTRYIGVRIACAGSWISDLFDRDLQKVVAGKMFVTRAFAWSLCPVLILVPAIGIAQLTKHSDTRAKETVHGAKAFVDTSNPAVPSAEEVFADIPGVSYWSRFQKGERDGWQYVLFPDGSGVVTRANRHSVERLKFVCTEGVSCTIWQADGTKTEIRAIGAPTPAIPSIRDGGVLAQYLAEWILAGTGAPPKDFVEVPKTEAAAKSASVSSSANEAPVDGLTPGGDQVGVQSPAANVSKTSSAQTGSAKDMLVAEGTKSQLPQTVAKRTPARLSMQQPRGSDGYPATRPSLSKPIRPVSQVRALTFRSNAVPTSRAVQAPLAKAAALKERERLSFAERVKLKCSVSSSISLRYNNRDSGNQSPGKPRISLGCSAKLHERLSVRLSLIGYLIPEQQRDWDPDFTYAFTYKISDTVSLGYSNYSGRFNGPDGGFFDALASGNLRANVKLPKLKLPKDRSLTCSLSFGLSNPMEDSSNLTCGLAVTEKLRVGATAHFYLFGNQGAYDPDFSYTASYRFSEDWLLIYSNYSNNRWNWNRGKSPGPGILGGSIAVAYSIKF